MAPCSFSAVNKMECW